MQCREASEAKLCATGCCTTKEKSRKNAKTAVNLSMVYAYFEIGRMIMEEEQHGDNRASYGKQILRELSAYLTNIFGKGFSQTNLKLMRIVDVDERHFYEIKAVKNDWSLRELKRQYDSALYHRLLLSTDKDNVNRLSTEGQLIEKASDLVKDPYVLEFLDIKDRRFLEKDLESNLLEHISEFLLELGRGFSFVARQKRIDVDGDNFYIDLVFYNFVLKCFVLIDLKLDKLTHQDIGQMDFYVRYYDNEIKAEDDNPTIGIILCSDKKDTIVKYSVLNDNKNLFASKYQLYLPTEEELAREIQKQKEEFEDKE